MKKFTFYLFICIIFFETAYIAESQNCNNIIPGAGTVGIHSGTLPRPYSLNIIGQPFQACDDVTFYLQNNPEVAYDGLLALTTNTTWGLFTSLETGAFTGTGNIVLKSGNITKDLIITNKNQSGLGYIRFATTQFSNPATDFERMTITPTGIVGININTPDASTKLEINGKVKIDDLTQQGTFMVTSDGNGILGKQLIPPSLNSWLLDGNAGTTYTNFLGTTDNQRMVIKTNNYERLRITPDGRIGIGFYEFHWKQPVGKVDINLGSWVNNALPRISFAGNISGNPAIRFYRETGNDTSEAGASFPWWIESTDSCGGSLIFRTREVGDIGDDNEFNMNTKASFINNGNVGISNRIPQARLQVTDGKVLFDGDADDGNSIPSGAGTRFMWIPEKNALRAGYVDGDKWDDANIGNRSVAFGYDNKASSQNSFAMGHTCVAKGWNCVAIGQDCIAGDDTPPTLLSNGIAIGVNAEATNDQTYAIGFAVKATGTTSTAMGHNVSTNGKDGSFIIGDDNEFNPAFTNDATINTNVNQMVMRFNGTYNDTSANDKVYRFITASDNAGNIVYEAFLAGNSNGLILTSDKNKKREISPVNVNDILSRLRNVPINTWKWKPHDVLKDKVIVTDSLSNTNMGPMAQDFFRQFPIGFPDSTALSTSVMDAVMFASIQALANSTDTIKGAIQKQQDKASDLSGKIDLALTKDEFDKFKDTIKCYINVCERVDSLENITDKLLTKSEFISFKDTIKCYANICDRVDSLENNKISREVFNSFKDSIKCYADACDRIKELEGKIESMQKKLDSLIAKDSSISRKDNQPTPSVQGFNFDDIILEQNNPNPFAETSEINYYIPRKYGGNARLILSDEAGSQILQQFEICNGKPCQSTISAKELQTGVYLYGIEISGKLVKSKKMMIIK